MKFLFQNPKFLKTVIDPIHFPTFGFLPEIAIVGRSNVGKSTLLNHLFKSKNLIKTSSTPGKTQAINFFSLNDQLIFADLPGYGYARVPFKVKKDWQILVEKYLSAKPKLILFLVDSRRIPNGDDLQMLEWIEAIQIPAILILTKVDKLKKNQRSQQTKNILDLLHPLPYVHYSVLKNEGRNQLIHFISEVLN
ncbi:MAG: ribosome biogenesis GTP-binding protein YihA/YsxC [Chlamydiales bacterium]